MSEHEIIIRINQALVRRVQPVLVFIGEYGQKQRGVFDKFVERENLRYAIVKTGDCCGKALLLSQIIEVVSI